MHLEEFFANVTLKNLLDFRIDDKHTVGVNELAWLKFKFGNGIFLINPETMIVYKGVEKIKHVRNKGTFKRIGKLVISKDDNLEIEELRN